MLLLKSFSRVNLYCILIILVPLNVVSQTDSVQTLTNPADTSKTISTGSQHSLYTGIGYGSNLIYLGSTISQDQPYGYGALTYGFKNEFYATVSAIHLSRLDPFLAFYTGSLNYTHVFNSWIDISAGVSRYQVNSSLADTLFSNFTYGDLNLGIDWRLIYSKLSVGGLFSDENQAYFQLRNSRYFQTPEFFKNKVYVSFDPYVNLLFGTLLKTETSTETSVTIAFPFRKWRLKRQSTPEITYSRKFGIMEVDFGLPVALNTDFMTVEAEANYILPVYEDPDFPGPKGFVFMLSCSVRIF